MWELIFNSQIPCLHNGHVLRTAIVAVVTLIESKVKGYTMDRFGVTPQYKVRQIPTAPEKILSKWKNLHELNHWFSSKLNLSKLCDFTSFLDGPL